MANTSATGGILTPADPGPLADADLDGIFQQFTALLLGMDGSLVRPRWQRTPPKDPADADTDWCAIAVMSTAPNAGPIFESIDDSTDRSTRHEALQVLATFYGANAYANALLWRDQLAIPQNLDWLLPYNMKLTATDDAPRRVPDFTHQQWVNRWDIGAEFARSTVRDYAILTLESADVEIITPTSTRAIHVEPAGD